MENIIVAIILLAIVGLAARYVYKAKKNGHKCIGCPADCCCSSKSNGSECNCTCCGCNKENDLPAEDK